VAGEFDIIRRYFAPLAGPEGLGLLDDAACIPARPNHDTIITKDVLVACSHFFENDEAEDIAFKAISVNVSDLVAKGADPKHYFVGLALPSAIEETWLAGFSNGLKKAQDRYGIVLAGGDTVKTGGPITVSVTAIGYVPQGEMVTRKDAKIGDHIYVTGDLGASACGLKAIQGGKKADVSLLERYYRPKAQLSFAPVLREFASAAADVSDGLLADVGHVCMASNVGAAIEVDALPISAAVASFLTEHNIGRDITWSGGDDYEIVFTVRPDNVVALDLFMAENKLKATKIGTVNSENGVELIDRKGNLVQISKTGYQHF
jgi:thiamine-monophosphate kinase